MRVLSIPCRSIRFEEFPDLLFGTSADNKAYFDATGFIISCGDEHRHNVQDFRIAFHIWIATAMKIYGIEKEDLIVQDEASGHLLIDECLALLFVVYIDSAFGIYLLERMSEMLMNGFTASDTLLVRTIGLRFTIEELTQLLKHHET